MGNTVFLFRDLELPTRAIGELYHGTNRIRTTDTLAVPTPVELCESENRQHLVWINFQPHNVRKRPGPTNMIGCSWSRMKTTVADKDMISCRKKVMLIDLATPRSASFAIVRVYFVHLSNLGRSRDV